MKPETNSVFADIKKQLSIILLNSTFADKVYPYNKISTLITFPEDIDIIKANIKRIFKYVTEQDIGNMTPYELVREIYEHNKDFHLKRNDAVFRQKIKPAVNNGQNTNDMEWSRKYIFSYILLGISRAMGRTVQSTERISDLMTEAAMSGNDLQKLIYKLQELENFFDIKIDQSMKVYNAANAAEASFIAQGRAPAPNTQDESMDPLWDAVMMATSIKYLKSVLQRNFNINVSTYALSHLKSYEELKNLIYEKQQQRQK